MNTNQRRALLRVVNMGVGTVVHTQTARSLIDSGYAAQVTVPFRPRNGVPLRATAKGRAFFADPD